MKNTAQDFSRNEKKQRSKNINCLVCFLFVLMSLLFIPTIYFCLWGNLCYWLITVIYLLSVVIIKLCSGINCAAHWLLLGFSILVFCFSSSIGMNSNFYFLFFIPILSIPFILNIRSKRYIIFYTVFPILLTLFLALFHCTVFPLVPQINDRYEENLFGKANVLILFIVLPVTTLVFIKLYQDIYDKLVMYKKILIDKNQELSKTNQELDNFVYSISHDLRAPISSMLGLNIVSKLENDPTKLQYYEKLKEKSLLKLDYLIKDILDYSRNSRIEVSAQKIDWQEYGEELVKQFEYVLEVESIEIEIEISQKTVFYTDLYRVGIIFNILISNALRYSDKYKKYSFLKIKGTVYEKKICLSFQDNGIGIAKEHEHRIFDMFYRASEESEGAGLGLYILKQALEKINGTIKLDSEMDIGSLFYIEIPNLL